MVLKNVPKGIRTPDPRLRRPLLYPAELQTQKRVMGIEPTYLAWKASVLPLNYTRIQSGWQDSNLRPPDPKSGALAKLSHTPYLRCLCYFSRNSTRISILYPVLFVNNFFIFFWTFFKSFITFLKVLYCHPTACLLYHRLSTFVNNFLQTFYFFFFSLSLRLKSLKDYRCQLWLLHCFLLLQFHMLVCLKPVLVVKYFPDS